MAQSIVLTHQARTASITLLALLLVTATVGCGHSLGSPSILGGLTASPEQQREAMATQWFHDIAAGNLKGAMAQSSNAGVSAVMGFSEQVKEHGSIASLTYHDATVGSLDATLNGLVTFSDGYKFVFRMIQVDVNPQTFKPNGRWLVGILDY